MYLTEKLKIFVGNLLCAEDHSEFNEDVRNVHQCDLL